MIKILGNNQREDLWITFLETYRVLQFCRCSTELSGFYKTDFCFVWLCWQRKQLQTQNTQHVALPFRILLETGIAGTERLLFLGRIIVREFEKILFHSQWISSCWLCIQNTSPPLSWCVDADTGKTEFVYIPWLAIHILTQLYFIANKPLSF